MPKSIKSNWVFVISWEYIYYFQILAFYYNEMAMIDSDLLILSITHILTFHRSHGLTND
ncbi:hypothetical protein GPLA_1384 [Paraglaciecola polaris LMG 21857]|uniref:Uncharacterized protein n=1 Tax=Paraglaciecola polaris LMG 21857 TaxID=1129793 RepID=K6ZU21_9ALTE|nr:hypothetical protein GPLA_1384 [Paraglaciecola polaris LMG 21857]|tara:strand:- start:3076 stop:3252 length:177 start_codon:yes stop_codon:yes gene_type:complete